jgi:hypothetical protein
MTNEENGTDSNTRVLKTVEFVINYGDKLSKLQVYLNKYKDDSAKCLEVSKKVFKASPRNLCSNAMWQVYKQYHTNQELVDNISKYIAFNSSNSITLEEEIGLIDKYCSELDKQQSQTEQQSQQPVQQSTNNSNYVQALKAIGFKVYDDRVPIAGKTGQKTNIINWLKGMCNEQLPNSCGYLSNSCLENQEVLQQHNIDYTKADIWNPKVYSVSEDTNFKLFIRESDISYDVLVKLPLGLTQFDFTSGKAQIEIIRLLGMFNSKGGSSNCSLVGNIAVKSIGYIYNIPDCEYSAVVMTISKDLLKFRKSNYLVSDYIDACMGASNNFDAFRGDFCLGDKIVIGISPGKLQSVPLHSSSPNNLGGCLVNGAAGSGKSVLLNSLLVQGLALNNNNYGKYEKQGNGAIVLLDAKANEWVKPWKSIIDNMGYTLYGFDGCNVDSNLLRYIDKKGNTINVNTVIPEYVLGMCFLSSFRQVIRERYGTINAKSTQDFNKASTQETLPRILILVDELNTMKENVGGAAYGQLFNRFLMAKDTRTVSYHWVLAGQNLTKSVVSSQSSPNYPYRIVGSMDEDGYKYHNIKVDKAVEEYEARTEKGSIMSQGMFYFGHSGNTRLIKSMYLPEDTSSLSSILQKLGAFPGLTELHNLVRWGLENTPKLYKDTMLAEKYPRNNFVIAALRLVGAINDEEFEYYSNVVMGLTEQSADQENQGNWHNDEFEAFSIEEPEQSNQSNINTSQTLDFNSLMNDIDLNGLNVSEQDTPKQSKPKFDMNNIDYGNCKVEVGVNNSQVFNRDGTVSDTIDKENIEYYQSSAKYTPSFQANKGVKKTLEKSPIATKIYANKLFDDIIQSGIKCFKSKTDIVQLTIIGNDIWLNSEYINDIPDNTTIRNIVSMEVITKRLKHLTLLEIDTGIMSAFYSELGDNAINSLFVSNKKLQHLTIRKSNGKSIEIDRQDAIMQPTQQDTESIAKDKLTKACNKSPKQNWELKDLTDKIYGFGKVQESFSRASNNIWHNGGGVHLGRAILWAALGVGTLGVASAFSAVVRTSLAGVNFIRRQVG